MNKRTMRQALGINLLAMLLCTAMLIGTTFAWFTDTASSGINRIQAGTLDVDLLMYKETADEYVSIADGTGDIFNETDDGMWEPGKTKIAFLAVENKGNLALRYNILIDVTDFGLAGSLDYAIMDGLTQNDFEAAGMTSWAAILAASGIQTGTLAAGKTTAAPYGVLLPANGADEDGRDYFVIAVHMREDAGNEYQDKSVTIDVNVAATQHTYESDSFGNQYDAKATFANGLAAIGSVSETVTSADTVFTLGNTAGTIQASGSTSVGADITLTSEAANDTSAAVVSALNTHGDAVGVSYNIAVTGQTPGTPVTVDIFLGTGLSIIGFYHNGTLMVAVNDRADLSDGSFYYDISSGYLTFTTSTFSTFTAVVKQATDWLEFADTGWYNTTQTSFTLNSASQLAGLARLTITGTDNFQGKTILLANDISLAGYDWTPIGETGSYGDSSKAFRGIFDGQGHTISDMKCNFRDTIVENPGLFASTDGATIQNLTLTGESGGAGLVHMSVGALTVRNCTMDVDVATTRTRAAGFISHAYNPTAILFENCTNAGDLSAPAYAGGFIGQLYNYNKTTVTNVQLNQCTDTGNVQAADGAGGFFSIIVHSNSNINFRNIQLINCMNSGTITATTNAGGFVGIINSSSLTITGGQNSGAVTGGTYAGGILGCIGSASGAAPSQEMFVTISGCSNSATITGSAGYVGQILGYKAPAVDTNQYFTVNISGNTANGTIVSNG